MKAQDQTRMKNGEEEEEEEEHTLIFDINDTT